MYLIKPKVEFLTPIDSSEILSHLELIGRVCYKSENSITTESATKFVKMIVSREHLAMIEHYSLSVKITCDRGVSHEIVRHRLASYAQESTRYCNYSNDKFGSQCTFIIPCWAVNLSVGEYHSSVDLNMTSKPERLWALHMLMTEQTYLDLLDQKWTPQEARSVLPNSLKTEIVVTMNLREWGHFFKMRNSKYAHPQMQEIAKFIYDRFVEDLPEIFE